VPDQERYRERQREPTEPERVDLHPRSLPAPDAERFGPIAPEPEWTPPQRTFDRERFLLWCVAWILGVQFGLLIIAGVACSYGYYVKTGKVQTHSDQVVACPGILDKIKESAAESLAVLLALLGGGAMAMNEYQKRQNRR
jgi:hypothetical protein